MEADILGRFSSWSLHEQNCMCLLKLKIDYKNIAIFVFKLKFLLTFNLSFCDSTMNKPTFKYLELDVIFVCL